MTDLVLLLNPVREIEDLSPKERAALERLEDCLVIPLHQGRKEER